MRKSGWAAAAGLVSAALLLTACGGGSSSTTGSGGASGANGSSSANNSTASGGTVSTATPSGGSSSTGGSGNTPQPGASSSLFSPPPGALYFSIRHSSSGYILTEGGKPVYEFAGDAKGKAPKGSSSVWPSVHSSNPLPSPADTLPGTLSTINGVVTYNGYPLYTYGSAQTLLVHPSAQWKLVILSASDIKSAG